MESIASPIQEISILVVEDDAITLEYLVTTLARKFPSVALFKALHGRTGLELFEIHVPDIVITDINMPELNGLQMADNIRAIKPDTKFIVLTGDSEILSPEVFAGKGFENDHYIEKPVDFLVLFAAIERCIGVIGRQNRS